MKWLSSRLYRAASPSATSLPTADYYFLRALAPHVASGPSAEPGRPIARTGPYTFVHGRRVVIVRYVTPAELDHIRALHPERVYYVLDDMLPIAHACEELPADYRFRLARFTRDLLPRVMDLGPTVVAPSDAILALFPNLPGERLDPALLSPPPDLHHFTAPGPLRLAFLGTRSHSNGLDFLAPVLEHVLRDNRDITLAVFLGRHLPARVARLPGVENCAPLAWADYRARMAGERFHLLLAPLPDTPFNRGRSLTKLMEAAGAGAALLASARSPFSEAIETGCDGLLLSDTPGDWVREIRRLAANREAARRLAEGSARLALRIGDPERLALFWRERLAF